VIGFGLESRVSILLRVSVSIGVRVRHVQINTSAKPC